MDGKGKEATTWTWADQISSYRFWGLLIFYILTIGAYSLYNSSLVSYNYDTKELSLTMVSSSFIAGRFAYLYGFLLAWIAIRTIKHYMLYICSIMIFVGMILTFILFNYVTIFPSQIIISLAIGAISIIIPSIIAGGRRGSDMFVVSWGILTLFSFYTETGINQAGVLFGSILDTSYSFLICAAIVFLTIFFLIPVNSELFAGIPPLRGRIQPLQKREPLHVLLLCFIPFFYLYWLYHVHGEIRSINNSPKLLSPRASVWLVLFIPILFPIIMATLNDCINGDDGSQKMKDSYSTVWIVFWSFVFFPIGAAMIQSSINRSIQS